MADVLMTMEATPGGMTAGGEMTAGSPSTGATTAGTPSAGTPSAARQVRVRQVRERQVRERQALERLRLERLRLERLRLAPAAGMPAAGMPAGGEMMATKNIVETATEAGTFTTLLAAAQAAGLVDALNGDGPLTVFAPTDDAHNLPRARSIRYWQILMRWLVSSKRVIAADCDSACVLMTDHK